MRNGVTEYISKPVDREIIKKTLEKFNGVIEERESEQSRRKKVAYQQLQYMLFMMILPSSKSKYMFKYTELY